MEPNLQPSIEETNSYPLSYWLTISDTNLPQAGPAAVMVDAGDRKIGISYKKKVQIGRIFEDAHHLRLLSFVDG